MEIQEIPIQNTILKSFEMVNANLSQLIRLGSPLIAVVLFSAVYSQFIEVDPEESGFSFVDVSTSIAYALALANAMVGAHRIFLMQSQDVEDTKAIRWSMRETRFAGWWLAVSLCTVLLAIPFSFLIVPFVTKCTSEFTQNTTIIYTLSTLVNVPIYYLFCRWSMVFPATAIDQRDRSLGWSWELSKGHSLRLFALIGGIPMATNIALSFLPSADNIVFALMHQTIWLAVGAIEICLLSLSYEMLSRWHTDNAMVELEEC